MSAEQDDKLAVFEGRRIRKAFHEGEWWFSIIDVVGVLVGGDRPRKYWSDLKSKLTAEGYSEVSEKIGQFKMTAPDGKLRFTDCANTETLFRIIQSIPSPKVEPLNKYRMALVCDPAVIAWLVDRGFSAEFGARNLKRTVQEYVEVPVVQALLTPPAGGKEIRCAVDGGRIAVRMG